MKLLELPIGSKIKFGKYQVETEEPQEICWQMIDYNHQGYPENSITFITEKIIDIKSFDAKEPNNITGATKLGGYNRYSVSNIDQWLNSSASAGNWYSPQHEYDSPPNETNLSTVDQYENKPGFLFYFKPKEIKAILETALKITSYPVGSSSSVLDEINRKVFLPGYGEIFSSSTSTNEVHFNVFTFNDDRMRYMSEQCFANTEQIKPDNISTAVEYFLRNGNSSGEVPFVNNLGSSTNYIDPYISKGISPIINLSKDTAISSYPDKEGYYTLYLFEWSEEWFHDSIAHWHECIGEECPPFENEAKNGYAPHTFGEWITTKEPTETERGIKTKTCTVCGFSVSEEIPSLSEKMTVIELTDSIKTRKPAVKLYLSTEIVTEATEYEFKVEACNNGFDANPTWEDITQPVLNKRKCLLNNRTKTANDWGVKIRITLSKKVTASPIILNGLVFSY